MPPDTPSETAGAAALDHLGVLRVQGADAVAFLQGQLTQDVALLPVGGARLAGYCSAKGRLLASFTVWKRAEDDLLLVCARDVLDATRKRLALFVLRAKVTLADDTASWALHGLLAVGTPGEPWSTSSDGAASSIALYPADGTPRALRIAPAGDAPAMSALAAQRWAWSEVAGGVATVGAAVADQFVPQMLNYESVGGVSFKKGCYPGQEVVARSQFRGTLKRRLYRVGGTGPIQVGDAVWPVGGDEPCGSVVQAAPCATEGWEALACLQSAAADAKELRLHAPDGGALVLATLPYELLADI